MRVSNVFAFAGIIVVIALTVGGNLTFAAASAPAQLRKQYEEKLALLKPDDEMGFLRLAQWCKENKLTKEAGVTLSAVLAIKRAKLAQDPTPQGFQALITWCNSVGLKDAAEEVRHEAFLRDLDQRKAQLKTNNVESVLALAQWCQQNRMTAEAIEQWQSFLRLQPGNTTARAQLASLRAEYRSKAPVGLLKNQKVPGYPQSNAWFHVWIPAEYRTGKGAFPLLVYLHGGSHNAGTADNVVALAQVIPPFKKCIVIFPNHLKTWWAHPRELAYLLSTMDQVMSLWEVDPKRIYLMGASMGGNGVWAFGSQCPELFAAVIPISGFYADFLGFPIKNLKTTPTYVLHGTQDGTVPIDGARHAFDILKKEGAPIEMHEIVCGHQPPNPEITKAADWMLGHTNRQSFAVEAMKERVSKIPVAGWLKQYEGN